MLKFSANISIMFQEFPVLERLKAAAEAGFKAVEIWFPYDIPAAEMKEQLQKHHLLCVGMNSPSGNAAAGDWGLAADPARHDEFMASVRQAMAYAQAIDCPKVHVMAGVAPPSLSAADAWEVYGNNIKAACAIAQDHGRQVLIEPLNALDRPSYLLTRQAQAIDLIRALNCGNLQIMLDLYHVQRGEGNLVERMRASMPFAGHIQIADVPGRHEPGTGEVNFSFVFTEIERLGYKGWIGCEYTPLGATTEGLGWRDRLAGSAA